MSTANRRARWLPLVYYYLATLVGLSLLLFGLIRGLNGLVHAAFPQLTSDVRYAAPAYEPDPDSGRPTKNTNYDREQARSEAIERARLGGFSDALEGLITTLVAAPVFFWHLRQARRIEPEFGGPGDGRVSESG